MKLYLVYLIVLFSFFKVNDGFLGKTFTQFQELVRKERTKNALEINVGEVEGYAFDQTLDHFEVNPNPRIFSQRFWRNKVYWREEDGPVFLYVGGEGGLDGVEIYAGHIVDMASQYRALLFSVEHRFYGKSVCKDCLKDENLPLLSSEQALADLAVFVEFAKEKFGLTNKNRWFTYGGSYPGSLAAWFRIKYPHLVFGAVASSAPVKAQVNFEGYNNVVEASLSSPIVGGSDQCAENIKAAFQKMENLVANRSFIKLKTDFKSCNDVSSPNDTWIFSLNLASFIMGIVQYNEQVPGLEISSLCKRMTNASNSPYENFAKLYQ
ncbi:thymus-specific serine protease, partial [Exaiptasia diaphana]|uniref:Uncharacterized protein n=1 Tax=Exaiptasia diaphana TaxID=2652724 RepID=A0A913Y7E3_EXADI